ncbi:MAG: hypothetical protein R3F16_06670 [Myxococcota bacterium]
MTRASDERDSARPRDAAALARRLAWLSAALIGLALAGLILLRTSGAARGPGGPGPVAAPAPDPARARPTPATGDAALPPAVERYLANTVYPPGSGRLTTEHADLIEPNARYEDFRPIPETFSMDADEVVQVRLTTDRYFYTGDHEVRLALALRLGERPIPALGIQAHATREGRAGPEGDPVALEFRPEGDDYLAVLDTARFADHLGPIVVGARIEYAPDRFHDEQLRFYSTPEGRIPARFTGGVSDALESGSLRVDLGIDVDQPGFYRIDANLFDAAGRPIAFSSWKGDLERSDRVVSVGFFGRILHDAALAGPYRVGNVRGYRFLDGQYPDREPMPDLPGLHATRSFPLDAFSDAAYTSAHKENMVRLLLEDAARGLTLDQPPLAAPAGTTSAGAASTAEPGDASRPAPPGAPELMRGTR